jgi:Zn-dependent protease with chaperone function
VQQLPGRLPRWRALWLLVGRPLVLLPALLFVLTAVVRGNPAPIGAGLLVAAVAYALHTRYRAGRRVTSRYRPHLRVLVDAVAAELGTRPPRRIGVSQQPQLRSPGPGRLTIGEPLLDRLTIEELRALIAHELSVQTRPALQVLLHRSWARSVTVVDPNRYARRAVHELDEFSACVEQYADHAAGQVTDPATAARAVARAWLLATAEGMPVRTVEWSPSLALRLARRHPDLTEALLALVGTELTTARPEPVPAAA